MLPESLTEEAVARWMLAIECCGLESITEAAIVEELRLSPYPAIARAVLALVEAKVREGQRLTVADLADRRGGLDPASCDRETQQEIKDAHDAIVARVMGREAPRA